jgi:CubicO group peptidase (beta-lactamase class C family)
MRKCLIFLFIFITLGSGSYAQNDFVRDSLDAYVARILRDWQIPGMAVCVVKDGKVAVMKGYGVRDIASSLPVDENTLFMIASNTKAFTGTALAILESEKRLSLDDKVTKYFPWFKMYDPASTADVRISDLVSHRLGLETFQGDFLHWGSNLTRKEVMEKFAVHKPVYPFRYKYGYCNAGYVAAGEIIHAVTDTTWDDFLRYRFFQPLSMNRTSTTVEAIRKDPNASKPYTLVNNKLQVLEYPDINNLGAAASINSSVADLSRWIIMLLDSGKVNGKQIYPFQAIQKTRTPFMTVNRISASTPFTHFSMYGLGWQLEDYNGRKIVRHDGGANGFVTSVCLVPEENLGIVVLTNTDANWMYGGLRHQLLQAFLGMPYKDISAGYLPRYREGNEKLMKETESWYQTAQANKSKARLMSPDKLIGKYYNDVYGEMEIVKSGKGVAMTFSHHSFLRGELTWMEDSVFICKYSDPTYGVVKIPFTFQDGKVVSCIVTVNDFIDLMPYEFRRRN